MIPFACRGGCHDIVTAKFSTCTVRFSGGPGTIFCNKHCVINIIPQMWLSLSIYVLWTSIIIELDQQFVEVPNWTHKNTQKNCLMVWIYDENLPWHPL